MPDLSRAIHFLRTSRLVAFPTETVYGLGADATNYWAIDLIYRTKGRPGTNPLIAHVADVETARRYAAIWPDEAQQLADRFWPGPLTIVLPKRLPVALPPHSTRHPLDETELAEGERPADAPLTASAPFTAYAPRHQFLIPDNATAGLPTVALRVPNHPLALDLLRAFGGALVAPSANRSTRVSPTTAKHVADEFPTADAVTHPHPSVPDPHYDRNIVPPIVHHRDVAPDPAHEPAMILDGGPCTVGIESTVVDLSDPANPTILRPGHVTADQIAAVLGRPVHAGSLVTPTSIAAASPGQHDVHYAPATPAYRFTRDQRHSLRGRTPKGAANGLIRIGFSPIPGGIMQERTVITLADDPATYARELYTALRTLDAMALDAIYVQMPPDAPEWAAVRDRLRRATRELPA